MANERPLLAGGGCASRSSGASRYVLAGTALALLYDYGVRVAVINQAYLDSELQEDELRAIDLQWMAADLISRVATPLLGAALLVAVITLAVHARGWQLTRERARARRPDPLAP